MGDEVDRNPYEGSNNLFVGVVLCRVQKSRLLGWGKGIQVLRIDDIASGGHGYRSGHHFCFDSGNR